MQSPAKTLSIVLAGGVGSRLSPLTIDRAKPAVPFGGQYRIIDFTLSNCLHSGLRQILLLTQYRSDSIQKHLRDAWSIFNPAMGEHITAVPPQMRTGDSWYSGTADAIYQNLHLIKRSGAKNVIVLSGDHIYRMDYSDMIRRHEESCADVTVACKEVCLSDARSFGVMSVDDTGCICEFHEKPRFPKPIAAKPNKALASMGIYVFNADLLCKELRADHKDPNSSHDFGKDILPRLIHTHRVVEHRFGNTDGPNTNQYWRDVGTIDSYYQANMDLLEDNPPLDLYSQHWPIRGYTMSAPPAKIGRDDFGKASEVVDSLLTNGVVVEGGSVRHSILSPGVHIASDAVVEDSVLFEGVHVGEGAYLRNCIVDKDVRIPAAEVIGMNPIRDGERFTVSDQGVVVIPKAYQFASVQPNTSRRPFQIGRSREALSEPSGVSR